MSRQLEVDDYQVLANRFNLLSFYEKIKFIERNDDLLTLASDGNWWGVKVKNVFAREKLEELEVEFDIEREWGSSEMCDLIRLLNMSNTDI